MKVYPGTCKGYFEKETSRVLMHTSGKNEAFVYCVYLGFFGVLTRSISLPIKHESNEKTFGSDLQTAFTLQADSMALPVLHFRLWWLGEGK